MTVLFDLEGTLVKSGYENKTHLLEKLHLETKRKLIEYGIPIEVFHDIEKSVYFRNAAYSWIRKKKKSKINELKKYTDSFLSPFDLESAYNSHLYENTIEVLTYLKEKKHALGVVTNTSQKAASIIFQRCELESFFDYVVTRDDVYEIKPDSTMILLANSRFKVKSALWNN